MVNENRPYQKAYLNSGGVQKAVSELPGRAPGIRCELEYLLQLTRYSIPGVSPRSFLRAKPESAPQFRRIPESLECLGERHRVVRGQRQTIRFMFDEIRHPSCIRWKHSHRAGHRCGHS